MPKKPNGKSEEPLQETKPKRGKPALIPVPKREDVLRNLRKVARPKPSDAGGDGPKE